MDRMKMIKPGHVLVLLDKIHVHPTLLCRPTVAITLNNKIVVRRFCFFYPN